LVTGTLAVPAAAVQFFDNTGTLDMTGGWTNYLTLADLDGDGDPDLVVPNCGGFFSNPQAQAFRVYRNNGGTFSDVTATAIGMAWTAPVRVVALGDVEGDGDLDMFAPSAGGQLDRLFVNNGDGSFADESQTRLPGISSHSAGARFGDVDADGDLDLVVAQGYAFGDQPLALLYLNDGTGVFTDFTQNLPQTGAGQDPDDVDLLDIDRDFDLDVLVNAHAGASSLWRNDGNGTFTDVSSNLAPPGPAPFHYGPSACDVDGDNDLDIWIDNIGPTQYAEQLLINDGSGVFSDQTSQKVAGNPSSDDNGVMCVDIDGDGDMDAGIPALSGNERILRNDGDGNFTLEPQNGFPTVADPTLWLDFADIDGDGRLDAVTGQGEGSPQNERIYLGNANLPVDTTPPRIIVVEDLPDTVPANQAAVRFAVSDESVTDVGPRLSRAYAILAVNGGSTQEVDAPFMGGDLFRAALPGLVDGDAVEVTVCAVDLRNNEACSQPQTFDVGMAMGQGGAGGAGGGASNGGSGPAGPGAGGGTGGDDGGGGRRFEQDDDCGCTVPGPSGHRGFVLLTGLVLTLGLRRRRTR
jgi:MYXO-CTERM domain-containing protein